jgi:hypothetical protein
VRVTSTDSTRYQGFTLNLKFQEQTLIQNKILGIKAEGETVPMRFMFVLLHFIGSSYSKSILGTGYWSSKGVNLENFAIINFHQKFSKTWIILIPDTSIESNDNTSFYTFDPYPPTTPPSILTIKQFQNLISIVHPRALHSFYLSISFSPFFV